MEIPLAKYLLCSLQCNKMPKRRQQFQTSTKGVIRKTTFPSEEKRNQKTKYGYCYNYLALTI